MTKIITAVFLSLFAVSSWAGSNQPALILPAGPGSTLDMVGRTLISGAKNLADIELVPLNRPGADGILAINQLVKDPTALLLGNTTIHAFNYHFRDPVPDYKDQDFVHISFVGWAPQVWYASKKSNIKNIKDLPKAITDRRILNIAGDNTLNFVNVDAVLRHFQSTHHTKVRYRSALDAVMGVASGDIDLGVGTLTPTLVQLSNKGIITILASSADSVYQSQGMSIPSVRAELNIAQFSGGYILSVSSAMDPTQRAQVEKTIKKIMQDPSTAAALHQLGVIAVGNDPKNAKQTINQYRDSISAYR